MPPRMRRGVRLPPPLDAGRRCCCFRACAVASGGGGPERVYISICDVAAAHAPWRQVELDAADAAAVLRRNVTENTRRTRRMRRITPRHAGTRQASAAGMEDKGSVGKVSVSSDSVSTLNSEDFVLVISEEGVSFKIVGNGTEQQLQKELEDVLMEPAVGGAGAARPAPLDPAVGGAGDARPAPLDPAVGGAGDGRPAPLDPAVGGAGDGRPAPLDPAVGGAGDGRPAPLDPAVGGAGDVRPAPLDPAVGGAGDARPAPLDPAVGGAGDGRPAPLDPALGGGDRGGLPTAVLPGTDPLSAPSSVDLVLPDSVVFSQLTYLGCSSVNAPRSEVEALRVMSILRGQCNPPLDVVLAVPGVSEGTVRLLDPHSSTEIANYPIYKILFCVRGHDGTTESDCFAFTESHYNSELFRIHVFRYKDKQSFKLRAGMDKKIVVYVQQTSNKELAIER
ncbi:hypothetical protein CRUP_022571 [Coryphaenoides rupestris]|nr:hypothetical protein CRUP_022571 [Coryphaenoides rupestris]